MRGRWFSFRVAALVGGLTLLLSLAVSGCRGNLPTGGECETLALRSLGIQSRGELSDPRVQAAVQRITTECIVTPFDLEMLACVERLGHLELCAVQFRTRQERR